MVKLNSRTYEKILTQALEQEGLTHRYITFRRQDIRYYEHIIYSGWQDVARIDSEPRFMQKSRSRKFAKLLWKRGLEIVAENPDFLPQIVIASKRLRKQLDEDIKVSCPDLRFALKNMVPERILYAA